MAAALLAVLSALAVQATASAAGASRHRPLDATVRDVVVTSYVTSLDESWTTKIDYAYWYERIYRARPSPADLLCLRNGTVYHAQSKGCHDLFHQGPCGRKEWLVMDGSGDGRGLRPQCARRPCMPGYEYFTDNNARICVEEQEACSQYGGERSLQYSLRGEGRCLCKGNLLLGPDNRCHVVYTQGPCPRGQMLAPSYSSSLDAMKGVCVPNPCREIFTFYVINPNGTVFENCVGIEDMRCAPMLTQLYTKQVNLAVPVCVDVRRENIAPPTRYSGCVRDNTGKCIRTTMRSILPYDWTLDDEDELEDTPDDRSALVSPASSPAATARDRRNFAPYAILSLLLL